MSREEREANLVIRGMAESKAESSEDRKREDRDLAYDTLKNLDEYLKLDDILQIFRTGRKHDAHPRLTIVKLNSVAKRNNILKNARLNTGPNGCKVRPDLTKAERDDDESFFKKLREENAPILAPMMIL